jgi:CCR4-NOT transcription complex subunit 6
LIVLFVVFFEGVLPSDHKQMLFVCTAHIHWDPEYCDVKVVQTLMLLSEIKAFMEDAILKHRPNSTLPIDCASIPLVLCGDFNSLPDSGKSKRDFSLIKNLFFSRCY